MTMSNLPNHVMTSQECKQYAMQLTARAWTISQDDFEQRASLIAEAQVWATLATVPELLEEFHGQILDVPAQDFPVLTCPHGYQANIYPVEVEGRTVQVRYSWRDCPHTSCP